MSNTGERHNLLASLSSMFLLNSFDLESFHVTVSGLFHTSI